MRSDIRQKLDELHLAPSAPVWQNIEASIKKERKRRLVLWLLPLAVLTTGITLWHVSGLHVANPAPQTASQKTSPSPAKETFSKPHSVPSNQTAKTTQRKSHSTVATPNTIKQIVPEQKQRTQVYSVLQKKQTRPDSTSSFITTKKNRAKKSVASAHIHSKSPDQATAEYPVKAIVAGCGYSENC